MRCRGTTLHNSSSCSLRIADDCSRLFFLRSPRPLLLLCFSCIHHLLQGEEWIPFDVAGSARSPGDIELFLWRHRRRFPHAMQALEAALPVALPAAAASAASAAVAAPTEAAAPTQPSSQSQSQPQPQPQPGLTFSLEEVGRMIAAAVGEVKAQLQAEQSARARAECLLAKAEARERQLQAQLRVGQVGAGDAEILVRQC